MSFWGKWLNFSLKTQLNYNFYGTFKFLPLKNPTICTNTYWKGKAVAGSQFSRLYSIRPAQLTRGEAQPVDSVVINKAAKTSWKKVPQLILQGRQVAP